ncbi:MAG: lipase family protein [Chitinophagales bacterium]|nr:hypothetical protein [Bacteroidota bacterium]
MKNFKNFTFIICLFIGCLVISCQKDETLTTKKYEYSGHLGDVVQILRDEQYSPDQIAAQLPSTIAMFAVPKYSVKVLTVEYKSINKDEDTVKASGIIIVPLLDSFSIPMISYQHGTVLPKSSAPSINRGEEYLFNLAIASSGGVLACITDYLGLGTGDGQHMYLNPREEANSVRDIMRCARKIVRDSGFTQLNGQVFLYGYSQGGHATMAAQRQLELENADEFKLTASAPMAGPYALSRTSQFDLILDSVYYPNPFYLPYLSVSLFNTFHIYTSYNQLFKEPYASEIPIAIDGYHSYAYANSKFDYYVSNMLLDSIKIALKTNPNHPIRLACKQYDLVDDWTPKTPTRLYHCYGDDNVFFDNAVYADSAFRSRGADVTLVDLGSSNHTDCAPTAIFIAYSWFNTLFDIKKVK